MAFLASWGRLQVMKLSSQTRSTSLSREFLPLIVIPLGLALGIAIWVAYEFVQLTEEAGRLTDNLLGTTALHEKLRRGINEQFRALQHQFDALDPEFPANFGELNYVQGEQQTEYLKLDIGVEERKAVEELRSLQSELGIISLQIFEQLRKGEAGTAREQMRRAEEIRIQMTDQFGALSAVQANKIRSVQQRLNRSMSQGLLVFIISIVILGLALGGIGILFQKRIAQPVHAILDASERIRQGDFSARAPLTRMNEIGRMAQGFNFMAESLAESYAGLERKVEERTRQLQELQNQLLQSEKMSAVGRLVSGVAHELNNPLASIMGFADLARSQSASNPASNPQLIRHLEVISTQTERCRRIVSNLLQFAGPQNPQLETVRINGVVEKVLSLREYEFNTRNISLIREYDPRDPMLCADPVKIQQVILNLLNNAHDAILETGRSGNIWVRTQSDDKTVTLEMKDDGTGVREPSRVFDAFYTTKAMGRGTGLGLSVCYGIVQEHGGEIRADNWEKGACFTITLPIGDLQSYHPAIEALPEPTVKSEPHIQQRALVVDDEELLLTLQTAYLTRMGVEAIVVKSGDKAQEYLRENCVDIIISDMRMPGTVDGMQLYEWIKEEQPALCKKFVFISGDLVGLKLEHFFQQNEVACLQKPFKFEDYSKCVRQVLHS
jgi:signal transduction histidine kinase